jgi:hypothetical protein
MSGNIKIPGLILIALFQIILMVIINSGCASRSEVYSTDADSTAIYPSKKTDGVSTKIALYSYVSKRTGKRVDEGMTFTIGENENVRAAIEFENVFKENKRTQTFHFDWLDPDMNSIYLKRIDISPTDSATTLFSSISVSPDKRVAGEYRFRIYHFRELIAEKKFDLRDPDTTFLNGNNRISASIVLCRSTDKKTGLPVGVDSVFSIKDKAKVKAIADLEIPGRYKEKELPFCFDWIDSMGKAFYRKQITLKPGDSSVLNSSVFISPGLHLPGNYTLQLYLNDDLISEKKFALQTEPEPVIVKIERIKASIKLCRKIDKETGEPVGEGDVFNIGDKENVRAIVGVENRSDFGERKIKFSIDWIGPDGEAFYHKQAEISPADSLSSVISSISTAPGKRQPGKYLVQINQSGQIVAEKRFELQEETAGKPAKKE